MEPSGPKMTPQMALGPLVDVVVAALHIEEPLSLELGPEGFDTGMQGTSQHALAFATSMCKHSLPTCASIRYQHRRHWSNLTWPIQPVELPSLRALGQSESWCRPPYCRRGYPTPATVYQTGSFQSSYDGQANTRTGQFAFQQGCRRQY